MGPLGVRTTSPSNDASERWLANDAAVSCSCRVWTPPVTTLTPTADAMPERVKALLDAGADVYITKPLVVGELTTVVDRLVAAGSTKAFV